MASIWAALNSWCEIVQFHDVWCDRLYYGSKSLKSTTLVMFHVGFLNIVPEIAIPTLGSHYLPNRRM